MAKNKTPLSLSDVTVHNQTPFYGYVHPYSRLIVVVDGQIPYKPAVTVEEAKFQRKDAIRRDPTSEPAVFLIHWNKQ